jgi:3-phytase
MIKRLATLGLVLGACTVGVNGGGGPPGPESPPPTRTPLAPVFETANEGDPSPADMDDPAVWVHPTDPQGSLIVAAAKKGGLRVYDLTGQEVQRQEALLDAAGDPLNRFNNVDVQYNFNLNGTRIDIAVATDRIQDQLTIWKIDPANPTAPLVPITADSMIRAFPTKPNPADRTQQIPNPDDGESTAYGLALYRDVAADRIYALATQNAEAVIRHFELVATADNKISATVVATYQFPYLFMGQDLTVASETDPDADFSPQFEGMSVDQRRGILYAGLEDVGLFRIDLATYTPELTPFYTTSRFDPASKIARDTEGVSIYYAADPPADPGGGSGSDDEDDEEDEEDEDDDDDELDASGSGYLLVSSQGMAHGEAPVLATPGLDDTFAVFSLDAPNAYLGSFSIPAAGGIDAVQECDGADIASLPLPGFPHGLLITQDGYNDDLSNLDGAVKATNLKLVPWDGVADNFPGGPLIKDTSYDPRNP